MRRKNCGSCKHFQPLFPPIPKADSYDIRGECVYPVPTLPFAWSEAQPFFIVAADGATCKTYARAALNPTPMWVSHDLSTQRDGRTWVPVAGPFGDGDTGDKE